MYLFSVRNLDFFRYLIQKNANYTIKNIYGCAAQDICHEQNDDETDCLIELKKFLSRAPNPITRLPKGYVTML